MEEVEDRDSPWQLSVQSQLLLDPSVILEEAPTAIQASCSSGSGGNGNKKTTTGKVMSRYYWYYIYILTIYWG